MSGIVYPSFLIGKMLTQRKTPTFNTHTMPRSPPPTGGYDIPPGVNPLTQLHAEEMTLPKDIAKPLRGALQDGSFGGGSAMHLHVSAMDGRSVERVLNSNPRAMANTLRRLASHYSR